MLPQRPAAKAGIVLGGLGAAFAAAVAAVYFRQKLTERPDSLASSGMYAGGEMLLGLGVFGLLSLLPLALALYWLRPVGRFWTLLCLAAGLFALTGPVALAIASRHGVNPWAPLGVVRILLMPLTALALLLCGLFAPAPKPRWILLGTALLEGGMFATIVVWRFLVPRF